VLVPLLDVAPDWVHPVLGQNVHQMHAALDTGDLAQIEVIGP
jgi:2-amino-4-hydroxy-6-hydroxymethyldihydropteridine diphosphokinase